LSSWPDDATGNERFVNMVALELMMPNANAQAT
jgi:hypothetical protein